MLLVPVAIAVFSLGAFLLLLGAVGVRRLFGPIRSGWFRRTVWWALALVPLHAFVILPGVFGFMGSRMVGTRGDERAYAGPRIADDGTWSLQSRESLRTEPPPEGENRFAVHFDAEDGVSLRAFVVPPYATAPRATVILVHGLFRGALELEAAATTFRGLGCEVILLELRNHGASGRAPTTFGLDESRDVVGAANWARARSAECAQRPLLLSGVSLGTASVAFAAPRIERLAGLVLEAPFMDALETGDRMLRGGPRGRRAFAIPEPFRSLTLTALQMWSGVDLAKNRPIEAVQSLPESARVLVIAGGADERMPPEDVRAFFDRLPQSAAHKEFWLCPGAGHGDVVRTDPAGYRAHVGAFIDSALAR